MATQSEQLAAAIAAITQLNQTYGNELAAWQAQRSSMQTLLNQAVAAVPSLIKSYWVDPINGNDANIGTSSNAPFATLAKALNLASATYSAKVQIYLADGVHEWPNSLSFYAAELILRPKAGVTNTSSNNIVVNFPESLTNYFFGGACSLTGITLRRTGDGGTDLMAFASLVNGAVLLCGTYLAGLTSSMDNSFKYTFAASPLVRAERGFGFFTIERSFLECIGPTPKNLWRSRNQMVVAVETTVSSNVLFPTITLNHVKAGVV